MSDPALHVLSLVGPVGNNALQAVGVASVLKSQNNNSIVVCSMGDGTSQQGEVFEAIAEAVRSQLPVLFLIEDNRYSISTKTTKNTFYSRPDGDAAEFYGLKLHRIDGRDAATCGLSIEPIIESIRAHGRPEIVILDVERLCDHTNSDDESVYRQPDEISTASQLGDPVKNLSKHLIESGVSAKEIEVIERQIKSEVEAALELARAADQPFCTVEAKRPLSELLTDISIEKRKPIEKPELTMLEAIREVLKNRLADDQRVTLFGEDIEDPKGDVFGITRGLSKKFPGRVINSALSESTIIGVSIGRALAGARPVAFIQFADFLPLAFNQINSELGSLYWRTNGGWECPVIIMVACGGFRPGLGPFHAQTLESVFAHVPGLDVFMPSNATDAATLLNSAFESGRPTVFFYPKACLNDRDNLAPVDATRWLAAIGKARFLQRGSELTLVTWGSTVSICCKVANALQTVGISLDLIDLRSISPWDRDAICESARRTGKVLVVHEDNLTCGFGAEVASTVAEKVSNVTVRRCTRPDVGVPCNFSNQLELLPSFKRTLAVAAEMLNLELKWEQPQQQNNGDLYTLEANGSSPADATTTIIIWKIKEGCTVKAGQHIADAESEKTVYEITSPVSGRVERILVPPGENVSIKTPLVKIHLTNSAANQKTGIKEFSAIPSLSRRQRNQNHSE
jgi:2-oxoisovalerate dehydrogenase E1 component